MGIILSLGRWPEQGEPIGSWELVMKRIEIWRTIDAPLEKVWRNISDFQKPIGSIAVSPLSNGDPSRYGAGTERMITFQNRTMKERIESVDPGKSYDYELIEGIPAKTYHGHAEFMRNGNQTDIRWLGEFKAKIPGSGWLIRNTARRNISLLLDELERTSR